MTHTEESIGKVLAGISASIPENLKKNVVRERLIAPVVLKIAKEAVATESIPKEKRDQIQTLIDSGDLSKKEYVENPRIAKMIDNYVGREINKAIAQGRLPTKAQLRNTPHFKKYIK